MHLSSPNGPLWILRKHSARGGGNNSKGRHTVLNVTVSDLLQDFRPYLGMARLVFLDVLGLETHNLAKATAGVPVSPIVTGWVGDAALSRGRRRLRCRFGRWGGWLPHDTTNEFLLFFLLFFFGWTGTEQEKGMCYFFFQSFVLVRRRFRRARYALADGKGWRLLNSRVLEISSKHSYRIHL